MNDEAHSLALLAVVKADNANVAIAVLRAASLHFVENRTGASSTKQRQFPHCPVVNFRVGVLVELNSRNVAHLQTVVNLLFDLLIGQWGQVRESLKQTLFRQCFHGMFPEIER